ncbi:BT_3987 domain-containing protein [Chitinophaga lutea]
MKRYILLTGVAALAASTSCKTSSDLLDHISDSTAVVYMPQATQSPAAYTFNRDQQTAEIVYGACYGGPHSPANDIKVDFSANAALATHFNNKFFTAYPVMPDGSYELEAPSATIPAGKVNTQPLTLKIHLDKLQGVGGYLLPITIGANSKVNEELRTTYFLVKALYTTNPFPMLDRSQWAITGFSSQEPSGDGVNNGRTPYALDGLETTWWSTEWKAAKPGAPHFITIDMKTAQTLHGFSITGRLDAQGNLKTTGNPKDLIVQTSADGVNWTYSENFTLENIKENVFYLAYAQSARFFKITVNTSQGDVYLTHMSELKAF